MKIDRFHMERTQCLYENEVKYNLSESGVSPLTIGELIPDKAGRDKLDQLKLGYPYSTGRKRSYSPTGHFLIFSDMSAMN